MMIINETGYTVSLDQSYRLGPLVLLADFARCISRAKKHEV